MATSREKESLENSVFLPTKFIRNSFGRTVSVRSCFFFLFLFLWRCFRYSIFTMPQHLTWVKELVNVRFYSRTEPCLSECRWSHFPRSSVSFKLLGSIVQQSPEGGEEKLLQGIALAPLVAKSVEAIQYNTIQYNNFYFHKMVIKAFPPMGSCIYAN